MPRTTVCDRLHEEMSDCLPELLHNRDPRFASGYASKFPLLQNAVFCYIADTTLLMPICHINKIEIILQSCLDGKSGISGVCMISVVVRRYGHHTRSTAAVTTSQRIDFFLSCRLESLEVREVGENNEWVIAFFGAAFFHVHRPINNDFLWQIEGVEWDYLPPHQCATTEQKIE